MLDGVSLNGADVVRSAGRQRGQGLGRGALGRVRDPAASSGRSSTRWARSWGMPPAPAARVGPRAGRDPEGEVDPAGSFSRASGRSRPWGRSRNPAGSSGRASGAVPWGGSGTPAARSSTRWDSTLRRQAVSARSRLGGLDHGSGANAGSFSRASTRRAFMPGRHHRRRVRDLGPRCSGVTCSGRA